MRFLGQSNRRRTVTHPYLYLPDNWDACWKAGKTASAITPAIVTAAGDSFTWGASSSDHMTAPWFPRLRADLAASYGRYADFWPIQMSSAYGTFASTAWAGTAPWTLVNGGATISYFNRPFSRGCAWSVSPGAMTNGATFVTPYACTAFDLWTYEQNVGTFIYTVDGGADQTVTASNGGYMRKTSVTGLANTTHTIVIKSQSGANICVLCGITTYAGATGIGFANESFPGGSLLNTFGAPGISQDMAQITVQGRVSVGTATGLGFPTAPHLLIFAYGINDCQAGYGVEGFRQNLRRFVQAARRGRDGCSVLILRNWLPDGVSSDSTTTFTNAQNWQYYLDGLRSIAEVYNCAYINLHALVGELGATNGYLASVSNAHPSDAGHALIYSTIKPIIL